MYPCINCLGEKSLPSCAPSPASFSTLLIVDATAEEFAGYVKRGYTAVKGGWGKSADTAFGLDPKRDLALVKRIREAIGTDIAFMLDVGTHVKWDVAHAIRMTSASRSMEFTGSKNRSLPTILTAMIGSGSRFIH